MAFDRSRRRRGLPWEDLRKILQEGQRMAKVQNGIKQWRRQGICRPGQTSVSPSPGAVLGFYDGGGGGRALWATPPLPLQRGLGRSPDRNQI